MTYEDIKEIFSEKGKIDGLEVISKVGKAIVTFRNSKAARITREVFDGATIDGEIIQVKLQSERKNIREDSYQRRDKQKILPSGGRGPVKCPW